MGKWALGQVHIESITIAQVFSCIQRAARDQLRCDRRQYFDTTSTLSSSLETVISLSL
jgi:hypothetical protein